MHLGGEFIVSSMTMMVETDGGFVSGNHDLSGLRVSRCTFDVGETAALVDLMDPGRMDMDRIDALPVGVAFRAAESFGVEFLNCAFRGAAAPAFMAHGGRFCLAGCSFDTSSPIVPTGMASPLKGVDVFLSNPPFDSPGIPFAPEPGTFLARNVVSRSPQFLYTFVTPWPRGVPVIHPCFSST